MDDERRRQTLFAHKTVRPIQKDLLEGVERAVEKKRHVVVHAPTGLGKTAASLGPAIAKALEEDLTIFFLTSRHTQHKIALETVKAIEEAHDVQIPVANLIGKKWMCLQPGVERLYANEFVEYCRKLRDDQKCSYYENLKKNGAFSVSTQLALEKGRKSPDSKKLKVIGQEQQVCPYEIGILLAREAKVVITDYFYVFSKGIREAFFSKINKELDKCIIIVDEAHNLPDRIKDLASVRISTRMLERGISEAERYGHQLPEIPRIQAVLNKLAKEVDKDGERFVEKQELMNAIALDFDLDKLTEIGDDIREEQQRSYIGALADFMHGWKLDDEGFARILTAQEDNVVLSFRCLDPGVVAGPVIEDTHSTILMSGTLTPTTMYAELLDVPLRCDEYTFQSPFPEENRLTMIVPETTTKYSQRSEAMYLSQARIIERITDSVPGNTIVFFPSYALRDKIAKHYESLGKKTVLYEQPGLSKIDREELLKKFSAQSLTGAVLLAATSGSFGEGVDLPGDLLKCVIVVGLPLARPDKETQALIEYYDDKFQRGWDYGYLFPAFNRVLQSAGRLIRSETDRGALVFLDERFTWRSYYRCFPPTWNILQDAQPQKQIRKFFGVKGEVKQSTLG